MKSDFNGFNSQLVDYWDVEPDGLKATHQIQLMFYTSPFSSKILLSFDVSIILLVLHY